MGILYTRNPFASPALVNRSPTISRLVDHSRRGAAARRVCFSQGWRFVRRERRIVGGTCRRTVLRAVRADAQIPDGAGAPSYSGSPGATAGANNGVWQLFLCPQASSLLEAERQGNWLKKVRAGTMTG